MHTIITLHYVIQTILSSRNDYILKESKKANSISVKISKQVYNNLN